MTAFLIIGGAGVLLLVVALILGDIFDGIFEGIGGEILSGAAVAGFLGALGFVGALVVGAGGSNLVGILVGLAAGFGIGAGVGWISAKLRKGGDESNVKTTALTGRTASVLTAIPEGGYGEVSMVASGHITRLNARSAAPVAAGTSVRIVAVLSATAVQVEPLV